MCAGGCGRLAPRLLAHVNLLLTAFAGAALATGARLKWDPTTYVAVRELFPAEYRLMAAGIPTAGLAALLLAHLATLALAATARRKALLISFAVGMSVLVTAEVVAAVWLYRAVSAWLASPAAQELAEALELREHLRPLLAALSRWHPLPDKLKDLIDEAEADAPRNAYVAAAAGAALLLLQGAAAVLAGLGARAAGGGRPQGNTDINSNGVDHAERALLKPRLRLR